MAKPICIVKVDESVIIGNYFEQLGNYNDALADRLPDYYVIVVPLRQPAEYSLEPIQFEVFHEKDFTEIQYEELKELIIKSIEEIKK